MLIVCSVPNSGSFIRPTAAISYGVTFLNALTTKYIEIPHGTDSQEKVILGSSGGAIEVEAVGLDKIRKTLARLERLRHVSLDNELVARADPPGEVGRTCTGALAGVRVYHIMFHRRREGTSTVLFVPY